VAAPASDMGSNVDPEKSSSFPSAMVELQPPASLDF
jgi:hypothetical protein